MSSKKNINNISKNYLLDLNSKLKFQLYSPEFFPKIPIKKIFLDCLSLKENNNLKKSNHKNNKDKLIPKKKSYSLYKYSLSKNKNNLYSKFCSKTQNKEKKILINCSERKQKDKILANIEKKKFSKIKIISNGSTRKTSDASPDDIQPKEPKSEIKNLKKININSAKNWKSLKINCINLKKLNNGILNNRLNNELIDLNNFKSKSKGKEDFIKSKDNIVGDLSVNPPQLNYFLNSSKIVNTTGKKNILYKNIFQKKIEPLKLFDYDVSSSSSSVEEDEREEKRPLQDKQKLEKDDDLKAETEFVIDSKFKISEGELSDELNGTSYNKDKKINTNIFQRKIHSNINDRNDCLDLNDFSKKNEKTYNSKLNLNLNQNQIPHKNKIISSFLTKAGLCDDKEKINQDSYIIIENLLSQNFNIYGIFDGHGDNGHLISKFISDYMNNYYSNKINYYLNEENNQKYLINNIITQFMENYDQIINNCSSKLDQEIANKINYDISQSGSTSIMVFLINETLICSNVGDSQCFLFNCSSDDLWAFESLSKLHLPTDIKEQKRILENGGEIHPYYDEDGIFEGPDRVYAKNRSYPGLSMSRTIGDLEAKKIGVISKPDIFLKKIGAESKFLVIGSDGLWDVIKPYDIIRIVRPYFNKGDIEGACQVLMKKSVYQWEKNNEERDDITIIVVFFGTTGTCLINEKINFLNKIDEIDNDDKENSSNKILWLNKKL